MSSLLKATTAQINYMLILFNDCGISTKARMKDFIQTRFQRSNLDDLSVGEASSIINELKEIKTGQKVKEKK